MIRRTLLLVEFLVVGVQASIGKRIVCLTQIVEPLIRLTNIPDQWQSHVASPLYLSSAGAAAGPPERLATLMGVSNWKRGSTERRTTYDLSDDNFSGGKWMECRYGEYSQIVLSARLDDKTKTCTVHFSEGEKAGQRSVSIHCH